MYMYIMRVSLHDYVSHLIEGITKIYLIAKFTLIGM